MATRRAFLGRIALGLGVVACRGAFAQPAEGAAYVGVETSASTGRSQARFFTASGDTSGIAPLDFRAHGMAQHKRRVVVFPRRPGTRFALIDLDTLEVTGVVTAPENRHFYGHGAFTMDGRHLLVTENDLDTLTGGIGVYDMTDLRRLGQIALPGSGPHEIVRAPERDVFHIALGGLQTHPDYGRTPLNLAEFQSQVVTLTFDRGTVEALGVWSGTEGISLRHLAVDGRGRLLVGGQIADRSRGAAHRILWLCTDGQAVSLDVGDALRGYVSSVSCHGDAALVTSKEGHTVLRLVDGAVRTMRRLEGASAAAIGANVEACSGYGTLLLDEARVAVSDGYEFDNHGLVLLDGHDPSLRWIR